MSDTERPNVTPIDRGRSGVPAAEAEITSSMREYAQAFSEACDDIGTSRELSVAKTRMQEAILWVQEHFRHHPLDSEA